MGGGYVLGTVFEFAKNLDYDINTALSRGFEGGLEGLMIGSLPPVTRYAFRVVNDALNSRARSIRRWREATLRLLPVGALYGAMAGGFHNYALGNKGDLNSFPTDWVRWGLIGAGVTVLPYLLREGQRNGVYGKAWDGIKAAATAYYNVNKKLYDKVRGAIPHPIYGRIAGGGAVAGVHAAGAGALYGLGRLAGML